MDKARACGANAYFLKNTDAEILSRFINKFAEGTAGDFYIHAPLLNNPQNQLFQNDFFELTRILSKREREVMHLLVKGHNHNEIEKALNITYGTFKSHRTNILQKLNVKNIAELVLLSMQTNPESLSPN